MFRIRSAGLAHTDDRHIEMGVFDHRLQRRKIFSLGEIAGGPKKTA